MDASTFKAVKYLAYLLIGIILFSIFFPFVIIGAGERSVVTRLGIINRTLEPGMHFIMPLIERNNDYSIRTEKEVVTASASSKDLQDVATSIALNYNVNPVNISNMYVAVKTDYKTILIDPALQEAIKASTAKYTAEELITKREEVTQEILTVVKKGLLERSNGIELITPVSIAITEFKFSEGFNASIEAKVKAEQDALTAKNKLEQIKFEAQQTIETAKAQAESIRIQANAINAQGGADYVQLKAIEKWNGNLPASMIPGATVPFINLTK